MTNDKILVIGQGAIGLAVTNELANLGIDVTGLARGDRSAYDLQANASFIQADALQLTVEELHPFTHIAIIVTPSQHTEVDYKRTYLGIAQHIGRFSQDLPHLKRIVFISSTGVYGQESGEWIDETVLPEQPKRQASAYILQAERVLQERFAKLAVVIRPSGIYGENRLMRIRLAQEDNKPAMAKYAWTNRIMDTDLVTIIVNVLTVSDTLLKPMYLATDYAPVTSYELTSWLASKLASTQPSTEDSEKSVHEVSGKRLHSNIPRDWLQYPDWQSGYTKILQSLSK